MRRSAWTIGVALIATLSLGVAACGSNTSGGSSDKCKGPRIEYPAQGSQAGREAHGPLGGRRRLHRLRPDVLPVGLSDLQFDAAAALLVQARRRRPSCPTWPRTPEVSADGKTVTIKIRRVSSSRRRSDRAVTSKDVKYAIERGFFSLGRHRLTRSTSLTSTARRPARSPGPRSRASRPRTTRPSSACSRRRQRRDGRGALACARPLRCPRPTPRSSTAEPVDLRRAPARHRPVHDRERRLRQGDRLRVRQAHPPGPQPDWDKPRTSSRPTSTRSTTSRATTTRPSPRAGSSTGQSMVNGDFSPLPDILKGRRPRSP